MTKKPIALGLMLISALLLTACGGGETSELPQPEVNVVSATETPAPTPTVELIVVTDGLGREVVLESPAERIISLAPSNTEILYALDAGEQMVGRDDYSDYPAEALELTSIGDTYAGVNAEGIIALAPDLVLAAEITPPEYVSTLEELGITIFYLGNPLTIEELYTNLEIVAELTGREAEAEALIADLDARVLAVDEALAEVEERPSVFYELDASDPAAPWTAGSGTFIDQLIDRAGGVNVGNALAGSFAQFSVEELVVQDPDVILLGDAAYGITVESVAERPGWGGLAAVQNDAVYPFDDNLVSRPGPRLVDALEQLAQLLHPELFE
jgi:iron complex transport system substrate-binding protein